jgi:metal-responsive CopG/Arc/MetJ family transcriptional regulator
MPRVPKNKKLIGVYIDKEVVEQLRELVKTKYEGQWGLSWEVEEAIRAWLRNNTQASKQKSHKNAGVAEVRLTPSEGV